MYFLKVFYAYYVINVKYDYNNLHIYQVNFCLFTSGTYAHLMCSVFPQRYFTSEIVNQLVNESGYLTTKLV